MGDIKPLEPLEILCSVKGRAYGEEWTEQGQKRRECRWFDVVPAIGESVTEQGGHSEVEYTRIK